MNTIEGKPLDCGMDSVLAWRLGEIALDAGQPGRRGVGDLIDRGLVLQRLLKDKGFLIIHVPQASITK